MKFSASACNGFSHSKHEDIFVFINCSNLIKTLPWTQSTQSNANKSIKTTSLGLDGDNENNRQATRQPIPLTSTDNWPHSSPTLQVFGKGGFLQMKILYYVQMEIDLNLAFQQNIDFED